MTHDSNPDDRDPHEPHPPTPGVRDALKRVAVRIPVVAKYALTDARRGMGTHWPRAERALQQAYRETYAYSDSDEPPGPGATDAEKLAFWQRDQLQIAMDELGIEIPEPRDYDLDTDEIDSERP